MARAWEAYKVRWAKEEDAMRRLMEKKLVGEFLDKACVTTLVRLVKNKYSVPSFKTGIPSDLGLSPCQQFCLAVEGGGSQAEGRCKVISHQRGGTQGRMQKLAF